MTDTGWPAGAPNEAEHRAAIAHALEMVPCASTISRGDLEALDNIISILNALAELGLTGNQYDDIWNVRNHLVPFVPGDEHYDTATGADGD